MMSGKPIGGQRYAFAGGVLDSELASGLVSAGNHVGCEVKCT
jgi:hypothetical protein